MPEQWKIKMNLIDENELTKKTAASTESTEETKDEKTVSKASPVEELITNKLTIRDLPTKFKPYPKGSVIKYYPFKFGELQVVNSANMTEDELIEFYLKGIETEGFDKLDLSYHDFLYIGLLRKISSFTQDKININFVCKGCGKQNSASSTLMDIEFEDISKKLKSLPVGIKFNDKLTLFFKPFTVRNKIEAFNNNADLTNDAIMLSYCCCSHPQKEAYDYISNATGDKLITAISRVVELLKFDNVTTSCKCRYCETMNKITLSEVLTVITPFREDEYSDDDLLVFE